MSFFYVKYRVHYFIRVQGKHRWQFPNLRDKVIGNFIYVSLYLYLEFRAFVSVHRLKQPAPSGSIFNRPGGHTRSWLSAAICRVAALFLFRRLPHPLRSAWILTRFSFLGILPVFTTFPATLILVSESVFTTVASPGPNRENKAFTQPVMSNFTCCE